MNTEFLSEKDQTAAAAIEAANDFDPSAWVRFWDNNTVQIDGDMTLTELETLVEMMKVFEG